MLLLVLLLFTRLHLVQLLTNGLIFLILLPHFQPFIQEGNTAFRLNDLTTEIVIVLVHGRDFFIKLLHGRDAVGLQQTEQLCILLELSYFAGTGSRGSGVHPGLP